MLISIKSMIQIITLTGEATSLRLLFFMHFCSLILKKIQILLLLLMICLCYFSLMRLSWLLYLYKFIKWKTIYEIKKIIEFNNLHYMCCKFGWFTRIHAVFFLIEWFFLPFSFLNIELIKNLAFQFIFSKIIPISFTCQSGLTHVNSMCFHHNII